MRRGGLWLAPDHWVWKYRLVTSFPSKRISLIIGVAMLSAGVLAGCGGGDGGATSAGGGGITTAPSAQGADEVATVPLSDGSQAVVASYTPEVGQLDAPGGTRVQAKVGDLVALLVPPAFSGNEWTTAGGTADGTYAELVGSGTAKVTPKSGGTDPGYYAFTYRAIAAGEGTVAFREQKQGESSGAGQQSMAITYTLVVSE
jgi:hypothetical protein